MVTEIVTETEKFTETVTRIEAVTDITSETSVGPVETGSGLEPEARIVSELDSEIGNDLRPGTVTDDSPFIAAKPEANCFAAILMGLKCGENPNIKPMDIMAKTESATEAGLDGVTGYEIGDLDETISTAKTGLVPDRDEVDAKPITTGSVENLPKLTLNSFQVNPKSFEILL